MSAKMVDRETKRKQKFRLHRESAGTPGGYRGRTRHRTGTASLHTHVVIYRDDRRARECRRIPRAAFEALAAGFKEAS